jgi:hypothetical protein
VSIFWSLILIFLLVIPIAFAQADNEPYIMLNSPENDALAANPVEFKFTATDDIDSVLTCTLVINENEIASNDSTQNGTQTTITATLSGGTHSWSVRCNDSAPNYNESEPNYITIDIPPSVTLANPENGSTFTGLSATFIWTFSDDNDNELSCTLFLDGSAVSNQTSPEGLNNSASISLSSYGNHQWNVECTDSMQNKGQSQNFTFSNNQPASSGGSSGGGGGSGNGSGGNAGTQNAASTPTPDTGVCPEGTSYCAGDCCTSGQICQNGGCQDSQQEVQAESVPTSEPEAEDTSDAPLPIVQPASTAVFRLKGISKAAKIAVPIVAVGLISMLLIIRYSKRKNTGKEQTKLPSTSEKDFK